MINKKDIKTLETKIKLAIEEEGSKYTPGVEDVVNSVTGPSVGLVYNYDTGELSLAEGWIWDNDGYLVKRDDVTGPDTGKEYVCETLV